MKYLLKNSNKPYDLSKHPLCGAKARHGGICRAKTMKNGRCKHHGGKTPRKQGRYVNKILELKRQIKELKNLMMKLNLT